MKTIRIDFRDIPALEPSVCAIGYFDGLHYGHQQLIAKAKEDAAKLHVKSAVATFDPDPWKIIRPDADLEHLSDLEDKETLLAHENVDLFYIFDFTREFASLSIEQFHHFLEAMKIKELVCGYDYSYGAKGAGNVTTLHKAEGFKTEVIGEVSRSNEKISSTRIEKLIREGNVKEANELLGYIYSIKGVVVHGYERGRILGYPTANLEVSPEAILPDNGVYSGFVQVNDEVFAAMINIGNNPTFDNEEKTIEANILDFHQEIYGMQTRFFFVDKLRDEKKFGSLDELKDQLAADKKNVLPSLNKDRTLYSKTSKLWSLTAHNGILNR
ncbi:MAG: bifunctional riboflavin kinase/FAD synthetase [Allobaculum sp.]